MEKYVWLLLISVLVISCKNDAIKGQAAKEQEKTINQSDPNTQKINPSEIQESPSRSEIKKVSIAEAKALAKQGYKFLDIRLPEEIERGKIEGAIELNIKSYDFQHKVNELDRNIKLIVYCSAGNRSAVASKLFSILEFTNVVEMPGGYSEWRTTENK
jgi:rhodanese-related sulfurtransferase